MYHALLKKFFLILLCNHMRTQSDLSFVWSFGTVVNHSFLSTLSKDRYYLPLSSPFSLSGQFLFFSFRKQFQTSSESKGGKGENSSNRETQDDTYISLKGFLGLLVSFKSSRLKHSHVQALSCFRIETFLFHFVPSILTRETEILL
jgi:hypothetical protein